MRPSSPARLYTRKAASACPELLEGEIKMISCINLFRKKTDMTQAEFNSRWANGHAALCMAIPGICGYEQNAVFLKEKGDAYSELVTADGFSIERYETLHEYKAAAEDRRSFADRVDTYVCLENISIPASVQNGAKKKMTLLGRTERKVSFEDFTREWLVLHSGCMVKMPRDIFFGYNQHLIIDRLINGRHVPYEDLPSDGILELYYSEPEAVANAFKTTPEGRMTVAHRNAFQVNYKKFK